MPKQNIALVGCGGWGKNHLRNWAALGVLRQVCDASQERRALARSQANDVDTTADFGAVLANPAVEGVVIATPAATHAELALRALDAGKDVLVEKPLALTSAEGAQVVAKAKERNRILMVGHVLIYHTAVRRLISLVRDGALGRIRYIYSNRLNLGKIRTEENSLWSFAPHDVTLMLALLGDAEPTDISCTGGAYLNQNVADVTLTTLTFPGGVRGHIFVSWLHPFKEQRFVVVCEKQMAVFDDTRPWNEKLALYSHRVDWLEGQMPVAHRAEATFVELDANEPLRAECEHFLQCMDRRETPLSDGDSALRVLQVLEAAQQSLDSGGEPARGLESPSDGTRYFAHPTATIDDDVEIGHGTRVWHYSHIMPGARIGHGCNLGQNVFVGPGARIGNGVKIQNNVSVYDGVELEDHVFCGPSMVFTNVLNPRSAIEKKDQFRPTRVRQGATLGANCTVICGNTIGRHALVGAGSVVTSAVPDFAIVWGVPARQSGWVCLCGETLRLRDDQATCAACDRSYALTAPDTLELAGD